MDTNANSGKGSGNSRQNIMLKGNALRLGETGLLLCGAAGAGKSSLALALLERAAACGRSAALIGDDYVLVRCAHGDVYAEAPPHICGALEIRGAGVFAMPYEAQVRLRLVVELAERGERFPQGHFWRCPCVPQEIADNCDSVGHTAGECVMMQPQQKQKVMPPAEEGALLPLLKLPQVGCADILSLCQAIEAYIFKKRYDTI